MKMVFALFAAVFLMMTGAAAVEFPITGAYGNPMGCADALNRDALGDVEEMIFVTPHSVVMFEATCIPIGKEPDGSYLMKCGDDGGEWLGAFRADLSSDQRTLTYAGIELARCE